MNYLEYANKHISEKYRQTFIASRNGTASPRKAIKAMCQQCVGYHKVNELIPSCESKLCPLWAYRPYQKRAHE